MITKIKELNQRLTGITGKLPVIALTALLAACGGGSGGSDGNNNSGSSSSSSGGGSSSSGGSGSSSGGATDTQPIAVDDTIIGAEDTDIVIAVLDNDELGENGISSLMVKSAPKYGHTRVDDAGTPADKSDDTITYIPSVDFNGADSFTYEVSDTDGDTSAGEVSITVTPTAELTAAAVAGGDGTNPKMLKLSWSIDVPVDHYRIEVNPDGSSGYSDSGHDDIPADRTSAEVEIPLHVTFWDKARMQLIALDNNERIIERSNEISLNEVDASSMIGYFKRTLPASGDTTPDDYLVLGYSVALSADGSMMAVGAPGYGPNSGGGVYMFHHSADGWTSYLQGSEPVLRSTDTTHAIGDFIGISVSLSADGKFLAAGVPGYGKTSSGSIDVSADHGGVFFFAYDENADENAKWKFLTADINPLEDDSQYGIALDMSADGSTLVVASGNYFSRATARVEVLKLNSDRQVTSRKIIHTDEARGGLSIAVSDDGSTIAVGSIENNSAYIYRASDNYSTAQLVTADTQEEEDEFGISVDISGDGKILVIGAAGDDTSGAGINPVHDNLLPDSGAAYVFEESASGWNQVAYIKAFQPGEGFRFGESVAISRDGARLAIGSQYEGSAGAGINPPHDGIAEASGAVYTYYINDGSWTPANFLKAPNTGINDNFGLSIALTENGNTLAVGAPGEASTSTGIGGDQQDDGNDDSGAVYLY